MARTSFSTSNALTRKAWQEKLFRYSRQRAYFSKMMNLRTDGTVIDKGKKGGIIHVEEEFERNQGDRVTFGLRAPLTGDGVPANVTLEGNEESLSTYSHTLSLEERAHAVLDAGPLDRQRAMFSIDQESEDALADWVTEYIDKKCFGALAASPTRVFYNDGSMKQTTSLATAKAATTGKLTLDFMSYVRTWASTGGNEAQPMLRPVIVDGEEYYIVLCHQDALYDLKALAAWQTAQRDARHRGKDNPIFRNATAIWDGCIVHAHRRSPIALDGGAGGVTPWNHAHFLGSQSLGWAWGARADIVMRTDIDWSRQHGYGTSLIYGVNKMKFNSLDYGCLSMVLTRSRISDAA